MTFTPQGPSFGPPNQPAAGGGTKNLGFILLIAVAALGLINFLLGFAPFTSISGSSSGIGSGLDTSSSFFESSIYGLGFVFAGGVVAGVSLLPKQSYAGIAAALTLTGFFALVFAAFSVGTSDYVDISLGWGLIIVLILSFVQTVVAVAALLFEIGILKAPAPRPVAQQYGQPQPYGQAPGQAPGQPQGYGQAQYGQPQQAQQPGQYQQNPQYGQAQQQGYGGAHAAPVDPTASQPPYGQTASPYGQNPVQNPGQTDSSAATTSSYHPLTSQPRVSRTRVTRRISSPLHAVTASRTTSSRLARPSSRRASSRLPSKRRRRLRNLTRAAAIPRPRPRSSARRTPTSVSSSTSSFHEHECGLRPAAGGGHIP